ncbi:PIN domain-containing protein [Candidatus Pacearchaeota archaeon]|nr:PIN domain-containing protein [Candidatus Pacearchaeota archaeon]
MHTLIIDTNVVISALIKKGFTREILTDFNINFIFPEQGLKEIYFYKSEIIRKAKINEREFNVLLLRLLKYIRLIPTEIFVDFREEADKIMNKIDKDDVIFIACALAFDCPIWSDDKHFKKQKIIKIFATKEILNIYKNEN